MIAWSKLRFVPAILLVWQAVVSGGCQSERRTDASAGESVPVRVLIVELHGFVGCGIDAELLRPPLASALADVEGRPDAVVFSIDSGGGMLNRVGPLSDLMHAYFDDGGPLCLGWIERAESAAALVALNIPDIWIADDGVIGGAVGVRPGEGGWEALPQSQQDAIRYMAAACASRGGHDRDLALSMVLPAGSDGGADGARVLTALGAEEVGLARSARTLEAALDERFGAGNWVIDDKGSETVSAGVREAEEVRRRFEDVRRRFEIALRSAVDRDDPLALDVAESYFDEALAISTRDDPATLRAMAFSTGFEWISWAFDRLEGLSGGENE